MDVKAATGTNGKNIIQSALKEASKQNASELVLYLKQEPDSYRNLYIGLKNTLISRRSKNVKTVIVIFPNKIIKSYNLDSIMSKITKR